MDFDDSIFSDILSNGPDLSYLPDMVEAYLPGCRCCLFNDRDDRQTGHPQIFAGERTWHLVEQARHKGSLVCTSCGPAAFWCALPFENTDTVLILKLKENVPPKGVMALVNLCQDLHRATKQKENEIEERRIRKIQADREIQVLKARNQQILLINRNKEREYQQTLEAEIAAQTAELKKTNAELVVAREAAEASSRAKGEFLANMSHELRTPLNGISGMAELLMDTELSHPQQETLRMMENIVDTMLVIINDILDFSKIEAGKIELEQVPFDLRGLMEDAAAIHSFKAAEKGVEILTFIPPDIPEMMMGDPVRLRQVFTNLIGNAEKFTSQGEIFIQAEIKTATPDALGLEFSVKDTGVGVPEEKLATIFDSFVQADGSTTRQFGGTGLGTTISRQLVELMGGTIGVESQIGKGSRFWFSITLAMADPAQYFPGDLPGARDAENLSVLVATHCQSIGLVLSRYLISMGCRVTPTAPETLMSRKYAALSQKYDLVLLEAETEDVNGPESPLTVSGMVLPHDLPLIFITAPGTIQQPVFSGKTPLGMLTKPVRLKALQREMAVVLGNDTQEKKMPRPSDDSPGLPEGRKINVLVVDDYPINRKLVVSLLSSAGYQVDEAENGREAVNAFKEKSYDLILMDIQMPELDGHMATAAIRGMEDESGHQDQRGRTVDRTPIIALTAHAIKGYREKCLAAGMDDFMTKPLKKKDLFAMVEKWTGLLRQKSFETGPSLKPSHGQDMESTPVDMDMIRDVWEEDDLIRGALSDFLKEQGTLLASVGDAVHQGDRARLAETAHRLKGALLYAGAKPASDIAYALEAMAKGKNLASAADTLVSLEKSCKAVRQFILDFLKVSKDA